MDNLRTTRRSFIKQVTLVFGALWSAPRDRSITPSATPPFYAAGVRFHPLRHPVAVGEQLAIVLEIRGGERCYAIYSERRERIGYVPRELIATFARSGPNRGRVLAVDPHSVPWRRYLIEPVAGNAA